jgi:general L-amino acid transport system permease protein
LKAPARAAAWRQDLFGSPWRIAVTSALLVATALLAARIFGWGVARAIFRADPDACRALDHAGACWGVVGEKFRAIVFGRYPYDQQWRPAVGTTALVVLVVMSGLPRFWRPWLAAAWAVGLGAFLLLMHGTNALGLPPVPTSRWGGLPLSLLLSLLGLLLALPLGMLLALGRRSELPLFRALCRTYIEIVRGVPLISVLFMAAFMLPLLMPSGLQPDVVVRVLIGLALFSAAYLAEVIRGGLQSVPPGQIDSARALGLDRWQLQRHIVLPQALRAVVPALMNSIIGTLKDSSLVTVVGLYELTGALSLALGGDPTWRPFYLEGYLFISFLYWLACFSLSRYSLWLERRLPIDRRV